VKVGKWPLFAFVVIYSPPRIRCSAQDGIHIIYNYRVYIYLYKITQDPVPWLADCSMCSTVQLYCRDRSHTGGRLFPDTREVPVSRWSTSSYRVGSVGSGGSSRFSALRSVFGRFAVRRRVIELCSYCKQRPIFTGICKTGVLRGLGVTLVSLAKGLIDYRTLKGSIIRHPVFCWRRWSARRRGRRVTVRPGHEEVDRRTCREGRSGRRQVAGTSWGVSKDLDPELRR